MFKNHSSSITHKHQASITLYKITWLEKKVTNLDPPHKKKDSSNHKDKRVPQKILKIQFLRKKNMNFTLILEK
jgi:hypothetical protein